MCIEEEIKIAARKSTKRELTSPLSKRTTKKRDQLAPYLLEPAQSMNCTKVVGPSIKNNFVSNQRICTKKLIPWHISVPYWLLLAQKRLGWLTFGAKIKVGDAGIPPLSESQTPQ